MNEAKINLLCPFAGSALTITRSKAKANGARPARRSTNDLLIKLLNSLLAWAVYSPRRTTVAGVRFDKH